MIRGINRFLISIFLIIVLGVIYLSIFGINTNKFNNKIINQVVKIDPRFDLDLKKVKILLQPFELSINLKTLGSTLILENKRIDLESITSNISILKFLKNEARIKNLSISTKLVDIKNLIPFLRLINDSTNLYILEKFTKDGYLISDININFDENGNFKDDYEIKGIVKDGKFSFFKNYNLHRLNFKFNIFHNNYQFKEIDFSFQNIKFRANSIVARKKNNDFLVNGEFENFDIGLSKIKKSNLLSDFFKNRNISSLNLDSKNKFYLKLNSKLRIKDFNLTSEIDLREFEFDNKFIFQDFFPDIKNKFSLKNHKIKLSFDKDYLNIKGKGNLLMQKEIDTVTYDIKKDKKNYHFKIFLDLLNNPFLINLIKYEKIKGSNAKIYLEGIYNDKEKIQFKSISLKENENEILIKNLLLNKKNKLSKLDYFKINLKNKDNLDNYIELKRKKKNYNITGRSLDITEIVKNLLSTKNENNLSNLFDKKSSQINLNISKVFLDKEFYTKNLKGKINIKDSEIFKMSLNSFFDENKKITMTIQTSLDGKITTFYSDYAKPIVKKYDFIKGFEEGSLDFYSIKKDGTSSSQLKIYDFKLKKISVLTKILTLASLQGIADILSGEGIRFNEFEMKFKNKKNLMTINEIYAIGPAISVLMEGYIQKNELISLRGTLVPATTINKVIGSIPILGDILVGKKIGEGVFGVSFKIKGPPKKLETSVNPIKTLTPRFITRTLENIKKN